MSNNEEISNTYFCPNPKCEQHRPLRPAQFIRFGTYKRCAYPYRIQRFRCVKCRKCFSTSTQELEFREQKRGLNPHIFERFTAGLSNRQISRSLSVSEYLVRKRLEKLSRHALLSHYSRTKDLQIKEAIAYDGVENFARSQYEPNNVNQAIGMDSLFIYDFNFAPLNRKGRMSDRQKLKKEEMELKLGKFPKDAIRASTTDQLLRLTNRCPEGKRLGLSSDEHFQYRRSIERDLHKKGVKIDHFTVNSKVPRTFKNILFSVNHTDLLLRQHVKAFARETISFSKTHGAMILKYALFAVWKNYFRTQFIKLQKSNPKSNTQTPAMAVGICANILKFEEFFKQRMPYLEQELNPDWKLFSQGLVPYARALS